MNKLEAAYIAGFFDGDGSVRLQMQPRQDAELGFRVRTIISFAQKIGHEEELEWIRSKLGIGYVYTRNDGISELKIEGFERVKRILIQLKPFVHFKKHQVSLELEALEILEKNPKDLVKIAQIADLISKRNYVTVKKKYTADVVAKSLNKRYTPVTTDPGQKG